jgi:aminoglycoside phosphotransferase (APT) family kinase protein
VQRHLATELEALEPTAPALCHGDAALDQVLLDREDAFALVDFDDAAMGDPYADLGTMVAALPRDSPGLYTDAGAPGAGPAAAYLAGWLDRSGDSLDARRLRVHRLRAELAVAANGVHKGRLDAEAAVAAIERLRAAVRDG